MTTNSRIRELERLIQAKVDMRARLMEAFVDAPGLMQSKSDHTRQDIATEISIVDKSLQELHEVILQLSTLVPDSSEVVQIGHVVYLQIDEEPERFLLLKGLGGIQLGDILTLSVDTPIGQAILGKRAGSQVFVKVPNGQLNIRILSIE